MDYQYRRRYQYQTPVTPVYNYELNFISGLLYAISNSFENEHVVVGRFE